ncbi:hypothetical protein MPTK1_4g05740 [Marchantia polymorpha subsp. ruderalis]|uniref:Uncharacterized protein n=2 Tax=Marchantia polymorpha TaxID=3197 RepID=A0AAF6B6R4_MARPO|nr:hypothetical protein MARPO_0087s0017 [Marchantia polymorpha]BBN07698.1 hypothetical protein Mp_4g05740 [Marchantia polymorpha subsp. ruderalis]|eukprot:PTQ33575.1 hypothetical protein MARPO_0087s0017 [Marchantia polymorpha]
MVEAMLPMLLPKTRRHWWPHDPIYLVVPALRLTFLPHLQAACRRRSCDCFFVVVGNIWQLPHVRPKVSFLRTI